MQNRSIPQAANRATGLARPSEAPKGNPLTLAFAALRDGVRVRDVWIIAGTYFVCGASTNGLIGTHLIASCIDNGLPAQRGATLLPCVGAAWPSVLKRRRNWQLWNATAGALVRENRGTVEACTCREKVGARRKTLA